MADPAKPDCDICKETYALDNEKPNCKDCIPYLWPENQTVYFIYSRVCGQHIIAEHQPIDLNLMPVFEMMNLVGIEKEDQLYCLDLVQKTYHEVLKVQRKKK